MKKIKFRLRNITLLSVLLFSFIACDTDFASIGSGIIGSDNFSTSSERYSVITYNYDVGPTQSNTLPSNLIGFNNDPLYGSYTASVVSQMSAELYDPVFGENVVLDSVVLTIPYFSRNTDVDEEGNRTYELDSIFGDTPIKISVYENNYFLRDFNPDLEFNDGLKYFSDRSTSDGSMIETSELEGVLLYEDLEYLPSNAEITLTELNEEGESVETASIAPAFRVVLNNPDEFWENLIIYKEGEPELSNESNFLNHFRGLYIKAEATDVNGTMMMINLNGNGNIILYYTNDFDEEDDDNDGVPNYADSDVDGDGVIDNGVDTDGDGINDSNDVDQTNGLDEDGNGIDDSLVQGDGTFQLNFSGNTVNFLEDDFIPIPDGNPDDGDEKLYLKGAQGSMAIVNLFNGDDEGNSAELEDFKSKNWLINQAQLVFYVDQESIIGEEPDRIFLYDLNNNTALLDYFIDQSVSDTQIGAKIDHLQPLVRVDDDPNGAGIKYKIEITEHINNIFLRDSTNTKLGLVVTTNVNSIGTLDNQEDESLVEKLVTGSFLSTRGTVLFGNNTSEEDKKVELEIFYTEPDN
jgi:hypothetical protein